MKSDERKMENWVNETIFPAYLGSLKYFILPRIEWQRRLSIALMRRRNRERKSDSDWGKMWAFHIRNGKLFSKPRGGCWSLLCAAFLRFPTFAHSFSPHSRPIRWKIHYRKRREMSEATGSMCLSVSLSRGSGDDNGMAGNWDCWAFQVTFEILDGFFDS